MQVLFINYFIEPNKVVGAKRISYWHKYLPEVSGGEIKSDIVYCDIEGSYEKNYKGKGYKVQNTGRGLLKLLFKKDHGATWYYDLKKLLSQLSLEKYDFIIFSGSPFLQMLLISQIKGRTKAKVIVDFRDPFAVIPRFKQNAIKQTIKKILETRILRLADFMITVNEYCQEVIIRGRPELIPSLLINNGFDERVLDFIDDVPLRSNSKVTLALCGQLDSSRNPQVLFRALKTVSKRVYRTVYYGGSTFDNEGLAVENKGALAYAAFIKDLSTCHLGVIITSGKSYESTTKVFDYLAAGLEVLIITEGTPETGDLHNITKDLEGVYWVENELREIEFFLDTYKFKAPNRDLYKFSRRYGLDRFIELLRTLK